MDIIASSATIDINSSGTAVSSSGGALSSSETVALSSSSASTPAEPIAESSSDIGPIAPTESFTDSRDGKVYKLVKIGTQTWMAENLHYADSNLYNFIDAQTACPENYHLPTLKEFQTLVDYAGGFAVAGQKLKSTTGWPNGDEGDWNGTDDYGFNAKPVEKGNGTGTDQNFWSSTHNFHNFNTGDFLKINPYPIERKDYVWEENVGIKKFLPLCEDENGHIDSSATAACFINGEPDTKLSVRCLSDIVECGSINIDSKKQFCQDGIAYDICAGYSYDGTKYACTNDTLHERKTGEIYKQSWKLLNAQKTYGLFKDDRDGQYYKTIKIDTITWFAENLNYALEGSLCFNNQQFYCETYGRLYTSEQAHNGESVTSTNRKIQGICPKGTRLATEEEYRDLFGQYNQDLYSAYTENDYNHDLDYRENPSGFSMVMAGCYIPGRDNSIGIPEWDNLNVSGCYIGADFTHAFAYWWPNDFNSMAPNTYGSVRCIVE